MNSKRNTIPDVYKSRKKICLPRHNAFNKPITNNKPDLSSDAKAALFLLHSMFPVEKFQHRLPPIIFKHQLYSINNNKTETDRQLTELHARGEIRYFHLGTESDDVCIVLNDDYVIHVKKLNENNAVVDKFLNIISHECRGTYLTRETLTRYQIGDDEISQLFKAGVLTTRDIGSWWISIPGVGEFVKTFLRGRKAVLMMIRKSKYGEILQPELESRKLPKFAKLGINYHIHDVVGAELVYCINTTSGRILRERD